MWKKSKKNNIIIKILDQKFKKLMEGNQVSQINIKY